MSATHGSAERPGSAATGSATLVWVDLEMTGLDPESCQIVEIATIVTDDALEVVAQGPNLVIHQPLEVLEAMDSVVIEMHKRSGLWDKILASTLTLAQAEAETLGFVKAHVAERSAPLCGNSIWKDRQFIERHMKQLDAWLHYRHIDVSTLKELTRRWYPGRFAVPTKRESHRALDDILESIAELRFYQHQVFVRA
jgi:oligoribonuclease